MTDDADLRFSAAAQRNQDAILAVLKRVLPSRGTLLEIASGTGQHAVHFAAALPDWTWQPSDADPGALASIAAWSARAASCGCDPIAVSTADGLPPAAPNERSTAPLANLRPPLRLDVSAPPWPVEPLGPIDAVFCANLLHIAPWRACLGLFSGAGRHVKPSGQLLIYGPFLIAGQPTAPSNLDFDADLRRRDPDWGLRQLDEVVAAAARAGLDLRERLPMPANNQMLLFVRDPARGAAITAA